MFTRCREDAKGLFTRRRGDAEFAWCNPSRVSETVEHGGLRMEGRWRGKRIGAAVAAISVAAAAA